MTTQKIRPQDKWNASHGLVTRSYKLQQSIADEFALVCEEQGVSKKSQLERLMRYYIEEVRLSQKE